jgi:hypothetical protein
MFKCKCCPEKELRIAELKEQIEYFKKLLNPPERINKYELEEVAVMNGGGQQLVDAETLQQESDENQLLSREADGIFMGIYDEQFEIPLESVES